LNWDTVERSVLGQKSLNKASGHKLVHLLSLVVTHFGVELTTIFATPELLSDMRLITKVRDLE